MFAACWARGESDEIRGASFQNAATSAAAREINSSIVKYRYFQDEIDET